MTKCPRCDRERKPLFTSEYCECCDNPNKKPNDWSVWWECEGCGYKYAGPADAPKACKYCNRPMKSTPMVDRKSLIWDELDIVDVL